MLSQRILLHCHYTCLHPDFGNSVPVCLFVNRKSTTKRAGENLRDTAMEGGMMNLVQTFPATGVSSTTGESNEFVSVALFASIGLLASIIATMYGIVPTWF
jgi:hypothetical protein